MLKAKMTGMVTSVKIGMTQDGRTRVLKMEVDPGEPVHGHPLRNGDKVVNFYFSFPMEGIKELPQLGQDVSLDLAIYNARRQSFDQATRQQKTFTNLRYDVLAVTVNGKVYAVNNQQYANAA